MPVGKNQTVRRISATPIYGSSLSVCNLLLLMPFDKYLCNASQNVANSRNLCLLTFQINCFCA